MSETPRIYVKGDAKPAGTPDKLHFFTMRFCPFAQRTWLVLEHKKIPYDITYMGLREELPEWARDMNPNGQVPIIEHNDKVLYESLVVSEFLDKVYPGDKLTPEDPYMKAKHDILTAEFGKVISSFYGIAHKREGWEESWEKVQSGLDLFERELKGDFFGGSKLALLDLNIWPWFERIPMLDPGKLELPVDRFPKLRAYIERMEQQPAVQNTRLDNKTHRQFIETAIAGNVDYGVGLRRI